MKFFNELIKRLKNRYRIMKEYSENDIFFSKDIIYLSTKNKFDDMNFYKNKLTNKQKKERNKKKNAKKQREINRK